MLRDTPADPELQAGNQTPNQGMAHMPTTPAGGPPQPGEPPPVDWVYLAKQAFRESTNWLETSRRDAWANSLRAFNNLHPNGSKYLSSDYAHRSKVYRPKSRTAVRKAETQTAAAFFSTADVVSIEPEDDNDDNQRASAAINKELLNHHLTKTIPWFLTVVGARQSCEVHGTVASKVYWKFRERLVATETGPDGATFDTFERIEDAPAVDLIPPENLRFHPSADWRDPVKTSPYLIYCIPMFVVDVREMMLGESQPNVPPWNTVSDGDLSTAKESIGDDQTRREREPNRQAATDPKTAIFDFDVVYVHENFIRRNGQDWHYFSLRNGPLLTEPRPIKEVYIHGKRPFSFGFSNVEAFKNYPSSKLEMMAPLQAEANDVANLSLDNVKMVLNPRVKVRSGGGVDIKALRSWVPGKPILMQNPEKDVEWDRPPDVTASSFAWQDRINVDLDDLAGGFNNSSVMSNRRLNETVGGMDMLRQEGNSIGDYELRIFSETYVERTITLLLLNIQCYESDERILAMAGKKAALYQKFNVDEVTDSLLNQQLTVAVNVGIGATNPKQRLQNFTAAAEVVGKIFGPDAAQKAEFGEIVKEVFGILGYKDGTRFFQRGPDGEIVKTPVPPAVLQRIKEMQEELDAANAKLKDTDQKNEIAYAKAQNDHAAEVARIRLEAVQVMLDAKQAAADREMKAKDQQAKQLQAHQEGQRKDLDSMSKRNFENHSAFQASAKANADAMKAVQQVIQSLSQEAQKARTATVDTGSAVRQVASQMQQQIAATDQKVDHLAAMFMRAVESLQAQIKKPKRTKAKYNTDGTIDEIVATPEEA